MRYRIDCPIWWPLAWSITHGYTPIPFEGWIAWHAANLLPKEMA